MKLASGRPSTSAAARLREGLGLTVHEIAEASAAGVDIEPEEDSTSPPNVLDGTDSVVEAISMGVEVDAYVVATPQALLPWHPSHAGHGVPAVILLGDDEGWACPQARALADQVKPPPNMFRSNH